jgi:hypothetical protein
MDRRLRLLLWESAEWGEKRRNRREQIRPVMEVFRMLHT